MRYLTLNEVLQLHAELIAKFGGADGIRDLGQLQSAIAQPMVTLDCVVLYPTVVSKAAAIGFSLVRDHAFIDGNKRIGHAAMEVFLWLNGFEIATLVDEQEQTILAVASGKLNRADFLAWLEGRVVPRS